jgi:hypothetical protein
MDVKKEETLPQIAEMLQDPRFAKEVERWAKEERDATPADKRDRAKMRSETPASARRQEPGGALPPARRQALL